MTISTANGRRVLFLVDDLLREAQIPHFLIQGTALGAYRDQGFTPTERDIDFGVLWEDFGGGRLERFASLLIWSGIQFAAFARPFTCIRWLTIDHIGIHVDIVGYMKWKDYRFTHNLRNATVPEAYAIVHDAALLENYETVELFGRTFDVPTPIEDYLTLEYDDWRTPRDDNVSRTRDAGFLKRKRIPLDFLEAQSGQ